MSPRQHWHHNPLSERVSLAPDADESWRPDANWREWEDWLRAPMPDTYRALRRSGQGREHFRSLQELANAVGVSFRTLHLILSDLEHYGLIALKRARGTIITITVADPQPVPDDVAEGRQHLAYNLPDPPAEADVRRWRDYWCAKWEQLRGAPYLMHPRDRRLIRSMLATYGLDRLKRMAWWVLADPYHECGDETIRRAEISIGTFHARASQIASAWQKAEAGRKLSIRLKQQAAAERRAAAAADDGDWDDEAQQYRTPWQPRSRPSRAPAASPRPSA